MDWLYAYNFWRRVIIYSDSLRIRTPPLRISLSGILLVRMIVKGFLDPESRKDLTELARDGSAAHRLARRANALVLLHGGMSYAAVARVLSIDDDTVRTWHRLTLERRTAGQAESLD